MSFFDLFGPREYYVIVNEHNEVMYETDEKGTAIAVFTGLVSDDRAKVLYKRTDELVLQELTQTIHMQLPEDWVVNEDGSISLPEDRPKMRVIESDARISEEFISWFEEERERRGREE